MERLERWFFGAASFLVERMDQAGPNQVLMIAFVISCLVFACGWWRQRKLNQWLNRNPFDRAPLGQMEAACSIILPAAFLFFAFERAAHWLRNRLGGPGKGSHSAPTIRSGIPLRVATLGPTFFLAGIISTTLYWICRFLEPALGIFFGLGPGISFWEFALLGHRRELVWLLPLSTRPTTAFLMIFSFWILIWWTVGNFLRGIRYKTKLQKNYHAASAKELDEALPFWRQGFGVVDLSAPGFAYRRWATWMVAIGWLFLLLSASTLGAERATVAPGELAIAWILFLSWALHLRLRGRVSKPSDPSREARKAVVAPPPGWAAVMKHLEENFGCSTPEPHFERPIPSGKFSVSPSSLPTLSPLLNDLSISSSTPNQRTGLSLNNMQARVLDDLSRLGYVHLPKPEPGQRLVLSANHLTDPEMPDYLKARNQVVLAPEGSGKTTLSILAAANTCLIHSRSTLLITRSETQAAHLTQQIRTMVESSTLRWNLRLRRIGRDFASDLSRDIIPELVVVSLHQLVTSLLDRKEVYRPFLRQVGLIVVDDVESFAGTVEIHAQLAFARLRLHFQHLAEAEHLGEKNLPIFLILGCRSMHQTGVWARGLCGVEAGVRSFEASDLGPEDEKGVKEPARQLVFGLSDLQNSDGRRLTSRELIGACEAVKAPWHYRPCGDGRRHRGWGPLYLRREPQCYRERPDDATILILEGRWSEAHREIARLPRAGHRSGASEVAIFSDIDPVEEAACSALWPSIGRLASPNQESPGDLGQSLVTLPLPIIRPPSTLAIQNHLLADLLQHWYEVADLVDTFESPIAARLRHLDSQNMLHMEERRDIRPELSTYESKVFLRASVGAVESDEAQLSDEGIVLHGEYDKVRQIELVSPAAVSVRNRVDQRDLYRVEADSAGLKFYPGRIFEDSRGRFVVVSRRFTDGKAGAVEVEPLLQNDISSPRHRFRIQRVDNVELTFPLFEPELILLGRAPLEVGLEAVRIDVETIATYRMDRYDAQTRSRDLHSSQTRLQFQPKPLDTVALVLYPNPETLVDSAPKLRLGEARLLSAMLRFLMPLLLRNARDEVEVALMTEDQNGGEPESAASPERSLTCNEGVCIFDLHHGGNGLSRALFREGLEVPLRLCRHFLPYVDDLDRFRKIFDHEGSLHEVIQDGVAEPSSILDDGRNLDSQHSAVEVDSSDGDLRGMEPGKAEVRESDMTDAVRRGSDDPETTGTSESLPIQNEPQDWWRFREGLLFWLNGRLAKEPVGTDEASEESGSADATSGEDTPTEEVSKDEEPVEANEDGESGA